MPQLTITGVFTNYQDTGIPGWPQLVNSDLTPNRPGQ